MDGELTDRERLALRDERDRKIHEALGLSWLYTGRIVVTLGEGVSWTDWTTFNHATMPRHTTWVATERPGFAYLTRTYDDMSWESQRAIERAELDYRRALGERIPQTTLETLEEVLAEVGAQIARTEAAIADIQTRLDRMRAERRERAEHERAAWDRSWTARFWRWLHG